MTAGSDILPMVTTQQSIHASSAASRSIVNIAAYRFATLSDLPQLRADLYVLCRRHDLRGTILLSTEGINCFVAGERDDVDALLGRLRSIDGLQNLVAKESFSETKPFHRMLVKIKREIIAFGVDGIDPRTYTSQRLPPQQLKQWLDEGKPVTLLDTRNDFEVKAGTFRNAVAIGVDDFRDFPAAVAKLPAELKNQLIVTFCTGGIRCEKAAPLLEREGFRHVYQLDGGILKYFEECGGAHYNGQCFVFDQRVALDPLLREGGLQQCFVCQAVLSADEQTSPHYVVGVSCPRCYRSPVQERAEQIAHRNEAIRRAVTPLPGSIEYDNHRPVSVPQRFDGMELLDFLAAMKLHLSREQWREACVEGRMICRGEVVKPGRIVRAGERLLHKIPATIEPDAAADIRVLHEDDALVVIHKPAPLPIHPCGRFNRNSLTYILGLAYHPVCLRVLHRLDADTTGVVLFGKTRDVARAVQQQFENNEVKKTYLARVYGHPREDAFECHDAIAVDYDSGGMRLPSEAGQAASTRFRVLQRLADGTAVLQVEPLTGRTNQIRVHLWTLGHPIVGEAIYLRDGKLGGSVSLTPADPPMCLHAAAIELTHPTSNERVRYESAPPRWVMANTAHASV